VIGVSISDQGGAPSADLDLAHRLAVTADGISLPRFGAADLRVVAKPDLTPVSDADLAVETALRAILSTERPGDAVLGEEFGDAGGSAERVWVIDPIDGTKNFVRGVPVWATLIGLMVGGEPVLGMVSAPALGRRWWATRGGGAFGLWPTGIGSPDVPPDRHRRLAVSGVRELSDASLSYSSLGGWASIGALDGFTDLMTTCWRTRAFGDFYSYMLVAEGAVDIAAEPELSLWDLAALVPIVTEAGGAFTDTSGAPVGMDTRSAVASNTLLHDTVLARLGIRGPRNQGT
jgi:histidinol-phosphatase